MHCQSSIIVTHGGYNHCFILGSGVVSKQQGVFGMEERRFDVLLDVLKIMDMEALKHSRLQDGIKHVLNHFDSALTDSQKNSLAADLRQFAVRKQNEEDIRRMRHKLDEERYREMLESFCRGSEVW